MWLLNGDRNISFTLYIPLLEGIFRRPLRKHKHVIMSQPWGWRQKKAVLIVHGQWNHDLSYGSTETSSKNSSAFKENATLWRLLFEYNAKNNRFSFIVIENQDKRRMTYIMKYWKRFPGKGKKSVRNYASSCNLPTELVRVWRNHVYGMNHVWQNPNSSMWYHRAWLSICQWWFNKKGIWINLCLDSIEMDWKQSTLLNR